MHDKSGKIYGEKGKTYKFKCIILGKGEGTKFPELHTNAGGSDAYRLFLYGIHDYDKESYGLCMTIAEDGKISYRGKTYNMNRFSQELLGELIYAFPWPHTNLEGETYLSIVEYTDAWFVFSRVNIYDCEMKCEYIDYLDQVKVDLKVYCEAEIIEDTSFATFIINACIGSDEVVIDKIPIMEEADEGDKFRLDLTFYFDSEDVLNGIFILADDIDISD